MLRLFINYRFPVAVNPFRMRARATIYKMTQDEQERMVGRQTHYKDYIRQEGQRLRTPATAPITPPRAFYRPTGIRDTEEIRRIVTIEMAPTLRARTGSVGSRSVSVVTDIQKQIIAPLRRTLSDMNDEDPAIGKDMKTLREDAASSIVLAWKDARRQTGALTEKINVTRFG
uniref:Uncharacterized protein n=1 Tax=Heterorhabditis bacteriophora TaxID=37862 RepID=A0A1I7X8H9_HETBA